MKLQWKIVEGEKREDWRSNFEKVRVRERDEFSHIRSVIAALNNNNWTLNLRIF